MNRVGFVLLYLLAGGLWILLSDLWLHALFADTVSLTHYQTIKGLVFVFFTGLLLFVLIRRSMAALRRSEALLQERSDTLEAIIQASPAGIVVLDRAGRVLRWSPAAEEMLGWREEELRGRPPPIADDRRELWSLGDRVQEGEKRTGVEVQGTRKDGSVVEISVSAAPLRDAGGEVIGTVAVLVDNTEQKQHERQLVEAKERAEAMARIKSAFLTNMSHEIRTPLSSIIGFAQIISEEAPPSHREFADLICRSGQRLMDTLRSVLDLAQLEGGALRFAEEPVELVSRAREAVLLFQPQAAEKGLALRLEAAVPEPVHVLTDPGALDRVLNNLLSNAIKFTQEGSVTVAVVAEGTQACIRVQDTGVGIDPDFLPCLFEEFSQESVGVSRAFEGSGLGLTITKRLLDLMGGTIEVESRKGEGSVFTVRLPRLDAPDTPA